MKPGLVLAIEPKEAIPPDSHPHRLELSCPVCFTTIAKALAHDERTYRFACQNGHRYELVSRGVADRPLAKRACKPEPGLEPAPAA